MSVCLAPQGRAHNPGGHTQATSPAATKQHTQKGTPARQPKPHHTRIGGHTPWHTMVCTSRVAWGVPPSRTPAITLPATPSATALLCGIGLNGEHRGS